MRLNQELKQKLSGLSAAGQEQGNCCDAVTQAGGSA